jgi:hypothetical protein
VGQVIKVEKPQHSDHLFCSSSITVPNFDEDSNFFHLEQEISEQEMSGFLRDRDMSNTFTLATAAMSHQTSDSQPACPLQCPSHTSTLVLD